MRTGNTDPKSGRVRGLVLLALATCVGVGVPLALRLDGLAHGVEATSRLEEDPAYGRFVNLLTNYPPIENLVFEARFPGREPRFYQFRYQGEGFFARELTVGDAGALDSTTRKAAGRWNDDYWSYDAEVRSLNRYWLDPGYTDSVALGEVRRFEGEFSFFCNWGISADGINSLRMEGNSLVSRSPAHHQRDWVTLVNESDVILSNGLPSSIVAVTIDDERRRHRSTISYAYDPNLSTYPYPSEITLFDGPIEEGALFCWMKVLEITLGDRGMPLGREMFVPPLTAWGPIVSHVVVTNRSQFVLIGDRLVPMAAGDTFPARPEFERRKHVVVALIAVLLALPIWALVRLARNPNSSKQPTTN